MLKPTERAILALAAEGLLNKEIAEQMHMTSGGIDKALWTIYHRRLRIGDTIPPRAQRQEAIRQYCTGEAFE